MSTAHQTPAPLADLYKQTTGRVVYLDDTYQLPTPDRDSSYIVGAAVIERESVAAAREALGAFYSGEPLHASEMWAESRSESLHQAVDVVAAVCGRNHVAVRATIGDGDPQGDRARADCLSFLITGLAQQRDAQLFVADSRGTPGVDRVDQETIHDRSLLAGWLDVVWSLLISSRAKN